MRRLHPDPGPVDPVALISGLALGDRSPADRPYTVVNFVASVDGRATVDGGSTSLGSAGDLAIFRTLRGCADAVLAGTGTLRAEHYGRLVREPEFVALRERLGLAPQPPAVTITRRGTLPEIPLLEDPGSTLLVYAGADLEPPDAAADVRIIRRDPDRLSTAAVLADLRATFGVRLLLCEGGPTLFGELVAERVADELFLTLAATLAGGDGGAITEGLTLARPASLRLEWALEEGSSLFLRYALNPEPVQVKIP